MMQAPQTTLAAGVSWPTTVLPPLVLGMLRYPNTPRRRGAGFATRIDKGRVKPIKMEMKELLRQYISNNPGQSVTKICVALKWERKKVERYMTALRAEVGNGHFLLADLKVKP